MLKIHESKFKEKNVTWKNSNSAQAFSSIIFPLFKYLTATVTQLFKPSGSPF